MLLFCQVTGVVTDKSGTARWVLRGTWDDQMEAAKVLSTTQQGSKPIFQTGEYKLVWKRRFPPYVSRSTIRCNANVPLNNIYFVDTNNKWD